MLGREGEQNKEETILASHKGGTDSSFVRARTPPAFALRGHGRVHRKVNRSVTAGGACGFSGSFWRISFSNHNSTLKVQIRIPTHHAPQHLPSYHLTLAIMSAAPASGAAPTTKATTADKGADSTKETKPAAALEEDDEFEDFPVESRPFQKRIFAEAGADVLADWTQEDTEVPGDNTHLWEESWDDDDTSEDFSAQLKWVLWQRG